MTPLGKLFVFILLVLVISPALFVWCVNTIFGLALVLTPRMWLAIILLLILVRGSKK